MYEEGLISLLYVELDKELGCMNFECWELLLWWVEIVGLKFIIVVDR